MTQGNFTDLATAQDATQDATQDASDVDLRSNAMASREGSSLTTARSEHSGDYEVILYYKYVNLDDVETVLQKQTEICKSLGLSGRIRLAPEGINGTLYGLKDSLNKYEEYMEATSEFDNIQYKSSQVAPGLDPFDGELHVRKCSEITSTGPMRTAKPTALGGKGGNHLSPEEFHEILRRSETDNNIVVIDTRNHYETAVGTFRQAVDPKLRCFAQFPSWIEANEDLLKGKHVAMFCTGGIRCEKASAYVRQLGVAAEVSQLAGGIHSYLERFSQSAQSSGVGTKMLGSTAPYPLSNLSKEKSESKKDADPSVVSANFDKEEEELGQQHQDCFFEGINFQFDKRFSQKIVGEGDEVQHIPRSKCLSCGCPWSDTREGLQCFVCKDFVLLCNSCATNFSETPLDGFPGTRPENAILCAEHLFMADDWRKRVERLDLSNETVARHVVALERLLRSSERKRQQRGQAKRKARLRLQIERLASLAQERGEECTSLLANLRERDAQGGAGFAPFVPMFEWQPRSSLKEA